MNNGGGAQGRWISPTSAARNLGLFRSSDVDRLRDAGTVQHAPAGALIARAGTRATHIFVVTKGEVELRAHVDAGRVTMSVVRAGGVLTDIPMLLDSPIPFDAITSRDTELIAMSRDAWTGLIMSDASLCVRWMTSVARRLDDDRRRLVVVTSRPLVAQVAYLLLEMAERNNHGELVVSLSHTTMAHLLGARRQSVTRVMRDLRDQGLVSGKYGETVIVDEDGLRDVRGPEPLP